MPRTDPPSSVEFRAKAVCLARGGAQSLPVLAAALGVAPEALRQAAAAAGRGRTGDLATDERDELRRLRREAETPQRGRESPRKAAASCAQEAVCAAIGSSARSGPAIARPSRTGRSRSRARRTTSGRAAGSRRAPRPIEPVARR